MKKWVHALSALAALSAASAAESHEIERLISLAPTVMLAQLNGVGVEIHDGVTDGCMKWPTGVLRAAQETLQDKGVFAEDAERSLQIVANGYKQEGLDVCFVNIDLILDEMADVYLNNGVRDYAAFARFDIWRSSFMVSGARNSMQGEIQSRVTRAVEELVSDIDRSKEILRENDAEFYEDFLLLTAD